MQMLPVLSTNLTLLNHAFRIAIGDMVSNIQPFQDGLLTAKQPCILAGLEYDTPWTRDTAINIWNGAGLIFPEAARSTLLAVLEQRETGVFIAGQYWDAIIWTTGAWAYYQYTGDREMLALALEATRNSLAYFESTEFNPETGLFRGPACYGDGVAAYPDRYARTHGSSSILDWPRFNPQETALSGFGIPMQALSTNCLYYNAYRLAVLMAQESGLPASPSWSTRAEALRAAIQRTFWDENLGRFLYLVDPWERCQHQEGLGNCFAVLFELTTSGSQARRVIEQQVITPQGIPCVWPTFERYQSGNPQAYGRHSGPVWPHIQGFWAELTARFGREWPLAASAFRFELFKLAELAVRDGHFAELYHPVSGEIYGGVQEGRDQDWHSCRRQTWSASAYLRMILMGLAGMSFSPGGIHFAPHLPAGVTRLELGPLSYRQQSLNLMIYGSGTHIAGFSINGVQQELPFLPASGQGEQRIQITLFTPGS
jgi:glycogen debranching enzyme